MALVLAPLQVHAQLVSTGRVHVACLTVQPLLIVLAAPLLRPGAVALTVQVLLQQLPAAQEQVALLAAARRDVFSCGSREVLHGKPGARTQAVH